jgi:hypothetical protein
MNKLKIIFSKVKMSYLLLGLFLGLSISVGIIFVQAAPAGESWATLFAGVTGGQTLTAAKWNGLINVIARASAPSSEFSTVSTSATLSTQTVSSNMGSGWVACFLTRVQIYHYDNTSSHNDDSNYCDISVSGGVWTLTAFHDNQGNVEGYTSCRARCF